MNKTKLSLILGMSIASLSCLSCSSQAKKEAESMKTKVWQEVYKCRCELAALGYYMHFETFSYYSYQIEELTIVSEENKSMYNVDIYFPTFYEDWLAVYNIDKDEFTIRNIYLSYYK